MQMADREEFEDQHPICYFSPGQIKVMCLANLILISL